MTDLDERTRNIMVESGFMKDMLTLKERLPAEVVIWSFEHSTAKLWFSDISRIRETPDSSVEVF